MAQHLALQTHRIRMRVCVRARALLICLFNRQHISNS